MNDPIISHYELNIAATDILSGRTFHYAGVVFPQGLSLGEAQTRAGLVMAGLVEDGVVFHYDLKAIHAYSSHKVPF